MKDKEIDKLIKETEWVFAKTYAKTAPHEYIRRKDAKILFWELLNRIREHGKPEKFMLYGNARVFSYYYYNGYKYWAMNPFDPLTIIINRVEGKDNAS